MTMTTTTHTISIEIDTAALGKFSAAHLATCWHVAQSNPAAHGDRVAGELAGSIGFEIIRRWLRQVEPELYRHQGRDYYWGELRKLGKWTGSAVDGRPTFVPDLGDVDDTAGVAS